MNKVRLTHQHQVDSNFMAVSCVFTGIIEVRLKLRATAQEIRNATNCILAYLCFLVHMDMIDFVLKSEMIGKLVLSLMWRYLLLCTLRILMCLRC